MKLLFVIVGSLISINATADLGARELIETARETARLTRQYADVLSAREIRIAERKFLEIQSILLGENPLPDRCAPSTYSRAFEWARSQGWFTDAASEFADTVMAQPRCEDYLNAYTASFEWARSKGWFTDASKDHAAEVAPYGIRTHRCYKEAFEWARSQGWFTDRSKDHARRMCL